MPNKHVSVASFAKEKGESPKYVFKILDRLRIRREMRRGADSRGQSIAFITEEDAKRVSEYLRHKRASATARVAPEPDGRRTPEGWFYLLQLEPYLDPGRFKVGFATEVCERVSAARCFAPFVEEKAKWPCKQLWEKTAIDFVTDGCERLGVEVFRTASLQSVRERCGCFFRMRPGGVARIVETSEAEPPTSPTDGPAKPPGDSSAGGGPPSVS